MTESWLWELHNQMQRRIPDPVDYIEMRRKTFGSDLTMSLSRLALPEEVMPEVYRTRTMFQLEAAASDVGCLINDIYSYQKEIEFEGEIHNAVLIVKHFLECDMPRAFEVTSELLASRARQFELLVETELPVLMDDLDLDATHRDALSSYVERIQQWMAGVLRWHIAVDRYKEPELRRSASLEKRLSSGFAGPGTSAARLFRMPGAAAMEPASAEPSASLGIGVPQGFTGPGTAAARRGAGRDTTAVAPTPAAPAAAADVVSLPHLTRLGASAASLAALLGEKLDRASRSSK
jgi:germacradienol/geosmin synthase